MVGLIISDLLSDEDSGIHKEKKEGDGEEGRKAGEAGRKRK